MVTISKEKTGILVSTEHIPNITFFFVHIYSRSADLLIDSELSYWFRVATKIELYRGVYLILINVRDYSLWGQMGPNCEVALYLWSA